MTNKSKFLERLVAAFLIPFTSAAVVFWAYGHFSQRFGWPGLSYWECLLGLLLVGTIGYNVIPHVKLEWAAEDFLERMKG